MAAKTSSVYIRLEPGVKESAEQVLTALGLPLSNAVNIFLKQVAMRRCIPFPLSLPEKHRVETASLSEDALNSLLEDGYQAYLRKEGKPARDVFREMEKDYGI
ncbi:MAG: type II toxin-antitoxin system RelB/DinJ family antitoxin [Selenomonadaceae bacterium]|nr:type II toxin-antitoxin system RelB/DinJ family antitoxin [Selenomonadaceae bacterium]MBQ1511542.1 type II toxin-antitoxin system RelB/DinJ family antitoxin [Selenomonadaceae bacterium]MBQ1915468.1 type II toxin-antitoxin system RelB/DinJ family antitoxin [Selenomonadaceae bacterium]MBQ3972065.1 type II toxin-antitoxin system RelB/DinJ family antitoxin [Selenomonadaceae bacterium]